MTASKPRFTFDGRPVSRRRLLAFGAAVPAVVVAAKALPSRTAGTAAAPQSPAATFAAAAASAGSPALPGPAHCFC